MVASRWKKKWELVCYFFPLLEAAHPHNSPPLDWCHSQLGPEWARALSCIAADGGQMGPECQQEVARNIVPMN